MANLFQRTLFGLNARFFLRQLLIACVFAAMLWLTHDFINLNMIERGRDVDEVMLWLVRANFVLNIVFYPYVRYLYGRIWDFILGEREWYVGGVLLPLVYLFKLGIRLTLFSFAMMVVPVAWLVLYFDNR